MTLADAALKVAIVALAVAAVLRFVLGRRLAAAMARPRDEGGPDEDRVGQVLQGRPHGLGGAPLASERPGLTGIAMLADGPAAFAARVALIDAARISVDAQ